MVKKFSKIATAVALTVALSAPMLVSANTTEGFGFKEKTRSSEEIIMQKEKREAKLAETAAVKACVSSNLKTRNTALNDAWKAYLATNKEIRTTYNATLKTARETFAASAKDESARTTYKAARTKALADRKAALNSAWEKLKAARTAARDAYKATAATCKK